MKSKNKNEKGIALIITIMLSAIMMTTVFIASREMLDEARNSTRIDNSLIAYYAAEAGLEDALLQYRFDKNAEINPDKCINIDTGLPPGTCSPSWTPSVAGFSDRFYKVTMKYKVNSIADPITVNKDDILEFSLPDAGSSISFSWTEENLSFGSKMKVEITTYDKTTGNILDKQLLDGGSFVSTTNGVNRALRVKPWLVDDSGGAMVGGSAIASTVPGIKLTGITGNNFGGPVTKIESIGYFGGVQRKIVADVNRVSGQVLNIMDFVIYSGSDLVK